MVALKLEEQKAFTAGLFIGEIFDKFLVREAEIVTYNQFTIDGKVRQGYFSEEELEENRIEENGFRRASALYFRCPHPPGTGSWPGKSRESIRIRSAGFTSISSMRTTR